MVRVTVVMVRNGVNVRVVVGSGLQKAVGRILGNRF